MEEVLKVDEVAGILKVSRATVQRWCAKGKLPAFKIGQHWRISSVKLRQCIAAAVDSVGDPAYTGPDSTPSEEGTPR